MADIQVMMTLFVIVILGYALRKLGYLGGDFDKRLSSLIIDVTCPLLILSSVMGNNLPDKTLILPLIGVGFATYFLLCGAAYSVPRLISKSPFEQGIIGFAMMFGNVGFIGYPIVSSIFGPQAIFYAALLNMPGTLFIFTVGVALVKGGHSAESFSWKMLVSPMMVASYIAAIIVAFGIHVPHIVAEPVTLTGNITVPGSLLVIGSSLAEVKFGDMLRDGKVYVTALLRLLIVPLILYVLFRLCGVNELVNEINTIVIAMPVAAFGVMFCMKYERDERLMTEITFVSTVMAVVTIPLLHVLMSSGLLR